VGALALLNALADNGECALLGVIASQTGPQIVGAINAVNTYYGRGAVPIGLSPVDDQRFDDHYAPIVGDGKHFPISQDNEHAEESTALYRRLLNAAPASSVRIVVIGGQTCIRLLLDSEADFEGDGSIGKTGEELIRGKVQSLHIMGGNFADPTHPEHNIKLDLEAAQRVVADWPTPIVFSGFEIGRDVVTGGATTDPERNPVAKAYELFPAGGVGTIAGSASYDQTMAYQAVRGEMAGDTRLWNLSAPGMVTFPEAKTVFKAAADGKHRYMLRHAPVEAVEKAIEALMIQPPRSVKP